MINIIFEGHATSLDNERGLAVGQFDSPLSQKGIEQSQQLGESYRTHTIDAIFCPDMQRAYRMAEIAFADRSIPIIQDKRLRECDYGDFTHRSSSELESVRQEYIDTPFPNGESYVQVLSRVQNFLADLQRDYNGKTVLIIGHKGTAYSLNHLINHRELKEVMSEPWSREPKHYQLG